MLFHLDDAGGPAQARAPRAARQAKELALFGAIYDGCPSRVLELLSGDDPVDPNAKLNGSAESGLREGLGAFEGTAVEFALYIDAPPLIASIGVLWDQPTSDRSHPRRPYCMGSHGPRAGVDARLLWGPPALQRL
jgi:hypothetical protein